MTAVDKFLQTALAQQAPKSKARRRLVIIKQLSDLSRDGWSNATPADYEPLETELRELSK